MPQAEEALWVLDKPKMQATLEEARRLAFTAPDIEKIAENAAALAQVWGLKDYSQDVIVDILKLCTDGEKSPR